MPRTREPRIPTKKVKLELFSIHGHVDNEPVDYVELFRFLSSLTPEQCTEAVGDRFARVLFTQAGDGIYYFAAYSGSSEATFLVLDLAASTEEERGLERGKVVVRKTLGLIDPRRREAVVQLVHNGVRAGQIAQLIERFAQRTDQERYRDLSVEFTPIPGESFLQELEQFQRIHATRIRLARPNYDWEEYGETLEALGQDSNAKNLEVAATANRNGSLSKDDGLVGLLKDLVQRGRSIIKGASVRGIMDGQPGPITLDLNRHIESRTANVPVSATGQPSEAEVRELARGLLTDHVEPTP